MRVAPSIMRHAGGGLRVVDLPSEHRAQRRLQVVLRGVGGACAPRYGLVSHGDSPSH